MKFFIFDASKLSGACATIQFITLPKAVSDEPAGLAFQFQSSYKNSSKSNSPLPSASIQSTSCLSSDSDGSYPIQRRTFASSFTLIVPPPSSSNKSKTSLAFLKNDFFVQSCYSFCIKVMNSSNSITPDLSSSTKSTSSLSSSSVGWQPVFLKTYPNSNEEMLSEPSSSNSVNTDLASARSSSQLSKASLPSLLVSYAWLSQSAIRLRNSSKSIRPEPSASALLIK